MAVSIHVHTTHTQFTDGLEIITVEGKTVGECLSQLVRQYPGMEKALFAKKEKLLNTVEVYVNNASAYPDELVKAVYNGDKIHLFVMLSGG